MLLKTDRIKEILASFKNKKILILGDLMLDTYLTGKVTRISPEAPVPVVEITKEKYCFGGAANVALNILNLECIPILIGLIGKDNAGKTFRSLLKKEKIIEDGIVVSKKRPTTVKTRIIGDNQHITRVDHESREYAQQEEQDALLKKIDQYAGLADAVILQDYNKGVLTKTIIQHVISLCIKNKIPVSVDPKFFNFNEYKGVTFFKPNLKETREALAKKLTDNTALVEAGFELLANLKAQSVLITRGPQGMSLFEKNKKVTHIPTLARKVADVSGAGDTVIATLTAAYSGGASKTEAAALANKAAGIVVEEVGIISITSKKLAE
jgi:rfaE bifunctional protein kinase chain/domain